MAHAVQAAHGNHKLSNHDLSKNKYFSSWGRRAVGECRSELTSYRCGYLIPRFRNP